VKGEIAALGFEEAVDGDVVVLEGAGACWAGGEDFDVVAALLEDLGGVLVVGADAAEGGVWGVFVGDQGDLHAQTI
jgi:hypothetical protein